MRSRGHSTVLSPITAHSVHSDVRERNLSLALQCVLSGHGHTTRAGIVRETGLTSATVSSLLSELIALGYVEDGSLADSTGGKRATLIQTNNHVLGILVVVVTPHSLSGTVVNLARESVLNYSKSFDQSVTPANLIGFVNELFASCTRTIFAVGIQIPGSSEQGVVLGSIHLGWYDVAVAAPLESELNVPVFIVNDADAEALADNAVDGGLTDSMIYIHLGTGAGAAVIQSGRLLRGCSGRGGEIGHVRMVFGDEAVDCQCGGQGCLESVCSIPAIVGQHVSSIVNAAEAEDVRSRMLNAAKYLARAINLIAATLDQPTVVVGGQAPLLGHFFLDAIRAEIAHQPARGTRQINVRFARDIEPYSGVAQYVLAEALGVRWVKEEPSVKPLQAG